MHYDKPMRRRELLQAAATLPLPQLISTENRKPGATNWQLTKVWPNQGKVFLTAVIEGYCGQQSVLAGDTLTIHVSVNPARRFTIDIFRMGFYGGTGARHITQLGPFQGKRQDDPPIGPNRLRECR